MAIDSNNEPSPEIQLVMEFFLARQPILNRNQGLIAYELLFRRTALGPADVLDDLSATASVIVNASELGMGNVIGSSLGFVNIDAAVLMSDFVNFLPSDRVVLEILETVKATPEILVRIAELSEAGYAFALDDVIADSGNLQKLLPFISIIKIDIMGMDPEDLARLSRQFKLAGKKLLAEKVESVEEFKLCLELGFDYFQGYYFARPVVMTGKTLSPSQLTILKLMSQLVADAENADIERTFKQDASLALNLLRMVNTPGVGVVQRIDSLSHALMVLGRRQLERWLQILLYAEAARASQGPSPLLVLAATRGKLLELAAQKLHPGRRSMADVAFTVGIMSLMDTLFSAPMEKILEQINVAEEISGALLHRKGFYGDLLQLAEHMERVDEAASSLMAALEKLNLSVGEFHALQMAAYEWSDSIASGA